MATANPFNINTDLEESYETKRDVLQHLLYEDLTKFQYVEDIKQHAKELKQYAKAFTEISYQLSQRFAKSNNIDRCQSIRSERNGYKKDVTETLYNIDQMLKSSGEDGLSSSDVASVRSGFSLSSQLSARNSPTKDISSSRGFDPKIGLKTRATGKESIPVGPSEMPTYRGNSVSFSNVNSFVTLDKIPSSDVSNSDDTYYLNRFVPIDSYHSKIYEPNINQPELNNQYLSKFNAMTVSEENIVGTQEISNPFIPKNSYTPVSYTHLTLPTNREV